MALLHLQVILLGFFQLKFINCMLDDSNLTKINFLVNPHCPQKFDCTKPWIIYGQNNHQNLSKIHYLWSPVKGIPTFMIAATKPESKIDIDWPKLLNTSFDAVAFSPSPLNYFIISFQKLIFFNDINDSGKISNVPKNNIKELHLQNFEWKLKKLSQKSFKFTAENYNGSLFKSDAEFSIKVTASGEKGRSDELPHLVNTLESAQIEVVMKNLPITYSDIPQNFEKPRYALDMIILTANDGINQFSYNDRKSLNDENTPGVFNLISIAYTNSSKSTSVSNSGFLQWRPVAYSTSKKDVNKSNHPNINTTLSAIEEEHWEIAEESFVNCFLNNTSLSLNAQTIVSFGTPGNGFYKKTNYSSWTLSFGLGDVPTEKYSVFVISLISAGLGIPVVFSIVGGVYLLWRKRNDHSNFLLGSD